MAKKKPKRRQADPSTTVEIRLPTPLWNRVKDIKDSDQLFIDQTVRAIFGHDENFGMTHVVFSESRLTEKEVTRLKSEADRKGRHHGGYWKLCEG